MLGRDRVREGLYGELTHILVVDDHPVARKTIYALRRAEPDFDVVCDAADGTESAAQAKDLKQDVVILDISVPGVNGLEAALHIN